MQLKQALFLEVFVLCVLFQKGLWSACLIYAQVFKNIFHWSIVDLQRCINFYCIAEWFPYMYIYRFFFIFFSGMVYYRILIHSRLLLFIHSVYASLHLPTPDSQSVPPPAFRLGNRRSVLYVCVSAASISSLCHILYSTFRQCISCSVLWNCLQPHGL